MRARNLVSASFGEKKNACPFPHMRRIILTIAECTRARVVLLTPSFGWSMSPNYGSSIPMSATDLTKQRARSDTFAQLPCGNAARSSPRIAGLGWCASPVVCHRRASFDPYWSTSIDSLIGVGYFLLLQGSRRCRQILVGARDATRRRGRKQHVKSGGNCSEAAHEHHPSAARMDLVSQCFRGQPDWRGKVELVGLVV